MADDAQSAAAPVDAAALAAAMTDVLPRWAGHADELRDLDAALGDGDLGVTVASGATAIVAALAGDVAPADLSQPVLTAARAFASANPSTFAALVGGGLIAAGGTLRGETALDRTRATAALRALAARIQERGKAELGDKTILDALVPSIEALEAAADAATPAAIEAMRAAAWDGVRSTTDTVSQRGRAAWVGERGAGTPDPGATAYARLLDEVAVTVQEHRVHGVGRTTGGTEKA